MDLVYKIELAPGERIRIGEIRFIGNDNLSDRQLKGVMATKEAWFLS